MKNINRHLRKKIYLEESYERCFQSIWVNYLEENESLGICCILGECMFFVKEKGKCFTYNKERKTLS